METLNIKGMRFNRLLVLEQGATRKGRVLWNCVCDCGNKISVPAYYLTSNNTRSCGCLRKEITIKKNLKHGHSKRNKKYAEYIIWQHLKDRCFNVKSEFYNHYGGRGITVSLKWANSYPAFLKDMGKRPSKKHSVERVDNNGDYKKGNCVWALRNTQANNRRSNVFIEYKGKKLTYAQWEKETGISQMTLRYRISVAKWSIEQSLTIKPNLKNKNLKNNQ